MLSYIDLLKQMVAEDYVQEAWKATGNAAELAARMKAAKTTTAVQQGPSDPAIAAPVPPARSQAAAPPPAQAQAAATSSDAAEPDVLVNPTPDPAERLYRQRGGSAAQSASSQMRGQVFKGPLDTGFGRGGLNTLMPADRGYARDKQEVDPAFQGGRKPSYRKAVQTDPGADELLKVVAIDVDDVLMSRIFAGKVMAPEQFLTALTDKVNHHRRYSKGSMDTAPAPVEQSQVQAALMFLKKHNPGIIHFDPSSNLVSVPELGHDPESANKDKYGLGDRHSIKATSSVASQDDQDIHDMAPIIDRLDKDITGVAEALPNVGPETIKKVIAQYQQLEDMILSRAQGDEDLQRYMPILQELEPKVKALKQHLEKPYQSAMMQRMMKRMMGVA